MSATSLAIVPMPAERKRSKGLFWYCWYPADFMVATQGWPLIAKGAYRELLDAQWNMNGLPSDEAALQRLIMAAPAEWRVIWPLVRRKFPIASDSKRRNARLEEERIKAIKRVVKASNAAQVRHGGAA